MHKFLLQLISDQVHARLDYIAACQTWHDQFLVVRRQCDLFIKRAEGAEHAAKEEIDRMAPLRSTDATVAARYVARKDALTAKRTALKRFLKCASPFHVLSCLAEESIREFNTLSNKDFERLMRTTAHFDGRNLRRGFSQVLFGVVFEQQHVPKVSKKCDVPTFHTLLIYNGTISCVCSHNRERGSAADGEELCTDAGIAATCSPRRIYVRRQAN